MTLVYFILYICINNNLKENNMSKEIFTVTEDHLKLIKNFCVGWQDCDFGAPEIDPKHPYGNSSVCSDIANILGWAI